MKIARLILYVLSSPVWAWPFAVAYKALVGLYSPWVFLSPRPIAAACVYGLHGAVMLVIGCRSVRPLWMPLSIGGMFLGFSGYLLLAVARGSSEGTMSALATLVMVLVFFIAFLRFNRYLSTHSEGGGVDLRSEQDEPSETYRGDA